MDYEWDEAKRQQALAERGLDFAHAKHVFSGVTLTVEDDREDYGETRHQTMGKLGRRLVMVVWTPRGRNKRILSMRRCEKQERAQYHEQVARA